MRGMTTHADSAARPSTPSTLAAPTALDARPPPDNKIPARRPPAARLPVAWFIAGAGHPLMRAVGGEPGEQASIEVLNFLLDEDEAGGGGREEEAGGDRPGSRASGGCSRGYVEDFDESRSAVVFRKWFTAEQQEVGG